MGNYAGYSFNRQKSRWINVKEELFIFEGQFQKSLHPILWDSPPIATIWGGGNCDRSVAQLSCSENLIYWLVQDVYQQIPVYFLLF